MPYGSRRNRDDQGGRDEGRGRPRGKRDSDRRGREASSRRDRTAASTRSGPQQVRGRRPSSSGRVPGEVLRRLEDDPSFQVVTLDQQHWIDPFSGEAIACPDGYRAAAEQHWKASGSYRTKQQLGMEQLLVVRWRQDLMRMLPVERRLRLFGSKDQGWLNPYSGNFEPSIRRDSGRISMRTVNAIAAALARCPYAQAGVMLDADTLRQRQQGEASASAEDQYSSTLVQGIEDDLQRAKDVQKNMLSGLPAVDGYELGVHYTPHSGVSGDFYETVTLPDGQILIILGDVSGHGMQAALVVATALKTLRMLVRSADSLVNLIGQLNDEIKSDLLPGQFITMSAAVLNPSIHEMEVILAGHHQLLLANPEGDILLSKFGQPGMAIGLMTGELFRKSLKPERLAIEPGDMVVQFTDGLIESINDRGEEYGLNRFASGVMRHLDEGPQAMADATASNVQVYAGGEVDDDLTVLAIHRLLDGE